MAKSYTPSSRPGLRSAAVQGTGLNAAVPKAFVGRDLCRISPAEQQFEPTESSPVPQGYKMAGGA